MASSRCQRQRKLSGLSGRYRTRLRIADPAAKGCGHSPVPIGSPSIRWMPSIRPSGRRCVASRVPTASRDGGRPPWPPRRLSDLPGFAATISPASGIGRRCLSASLALRAGVDRRRTCAAELDGHPADDSAFEDGRLRRRCRDRHHVRRRRSCLPGSRAPRLAQDGRNCRWPGVPSRYPRWHRAFQAAAPGCGPPDPAPPSRCRRCQGHAHEADHATRRAGWVRDHGLQERRARRGNHGSHPTPKPDDDKGLCPAGQAWEGQPI